MSIGDVLFWVCPVTGHEAVVWEGAIARCEICGLTSAATDELVSRGQADQRQRDILILRGLARKIRAAREVGSDIPAGDLPLVPAGVLEVAASILADAPIGTANAA